MHRYQRINNHKIIPVGIIRIIIILNCVDDFSWTNILKYLDESTAFIHENINKGGVLVHCYAGICN